MSSETNLQYCDVDSRASGENRPSNGCLWYAVRVRPRFEKLAADIISAKGYEEFLPLYRSRRAWSDRVKDLDLPLLPGYFFCRFNIEDRYLAILTTPGVRGIVGIGKTPVPVEDTEIETIRAVVRSGLTAKPTPYLHVGARVSINQGPLAGLEGIITCTDRAHRFVVSVGLLQRSVAVEIDREWAIPMQDGRGSQASQAH